MVEIIGVRFQTSEKLYYFDPDGQATQKGLAVIVETSRGVENGTVKIANTMIREENVVYPLKKIIRIANAEDIDKIEADRKKADEAFPICEEKILKHKLNMKLVHVEYAFDDSKILFYFTADGRVDFRELVKDLATVFRTRIELRQIGVRDEAQMIGGLGICGRKFCCSTFLDNFETVTIKMAKEQSLSLNPSKISGNCGRLMCCLRYEYDAYEELLSITPKVGAYVMYEKEKFKVIDVNLLTGMLSIIPAKNSDVAPKSVNRTVVKLLKDSKIKVTKEELAELKALEG